MNDEFDSEEFFEDDEENCPLAETLLALNIMPKPFGMTWSQDQVLGFLKARGYRIVTRYNEDDDSEYKVAVKKNQPKIPDNSEGNVVEVFAEEIRNILLKWLLKIGKENDT